MWAAAEAAVRSARLRIVSCYEIPVAGAAINGWVPTEAYVSLLDAAESSVLAMRAKAHEAYPGIEISAEASAGPASAELVRDADADDLIVVGASSHGGAAAFWLGSTPRYVVRHSACPVVVVRGAASRGRPDRVVVGIDDSDAAREAVRWAGDEADRHQVGLLIVHCWEYPYLPVDTASSQARDLTEVDAQCLLDRAVEAAREQFSADVTGQLVEGPPVTSLLGVVRDGDLLVLGSRGRGALRASFFGSTVNTVLDRSAVPVAVVRGSDAE